MKIYYIDWNTESGDSGQHGYWTKKPTKKQQRGFMREMHPCEYEDGDGPSEDGGAVYWSIEYFESLDDS